MTRRSLIALVTTAAISRLAVAALKSPRYAYLELPALHFKESASPDVLAELAGLPIRMCNVSCDGAPAYCCYAASESEGWYIGGAAVGERGILSDRDYAGIRRAISDGRELIHYPERRMFLERIHGTVRITVPCKRWGTPST